jgi:purine-nucleoside phosphorylase
MTGMNPLFGPKFMNEYPRFLPVSAAYSPSLRRLAFLAANELQISPNDIEEGVYAWVSGPSFETPAEGRFLRNAGADVVGMSTVPEVLAAKESGIPDVMVISLVTNPVIIPEAYRSIKQEVAAEVRSRWSRPLDMLLKTHYSSLARLSSYLRRTRYRTTMSWL